MTPRLESNYNSLIKYFGTVGDLCRHLAFHNQTASTLSKTIQTETQEDDEEMAQAAMRRRKKKYAQLLKI